MIGVLDTAPYVAGALGAGGVGVFASRRRELIRRWSTWAVTAPVVGGAMLLGTPGAAVLAVALAIVAVAEYGRLVRLPMPDRCTIGAAVSAVIATAALAPGHVSSALAAGTALVSLLPVLAGDTDAAPNDPRTGCSASRG